MENGENEARKLVPGHFLFFKKLFIRRKQEFSTLILAYFGRPPVGLRIKINCLTFHIVIQRYAQF